MTPISWLGDDGRWMAQELLSTFASAKEEGDRLLRSVALVPSKGEGGGVFRVRGGKGLYTYPGGLDEL